MFDELSAENPDDSLLRIMQIVVRQQIAYELASRGKAAEAATWQDKPLKPARGKEELLFDVASAYVGSAQFVDKIPNKLDARQRKALADRYDDLAVSMLKAAVGARVKDLGRLRDRDFEQLRNRSDFPSDSHGH
jgi:hypothetical protein